MLYKQDGHHTSIQIDTRVLKSSVTLYYAKKLGLLYLKFRKEFCAVLFWGYFSQCKS